MSVSAPTSPRSVDALVGEIEQAIAQGDLESASACLSSLKPLLVDQQVATLRDLRARIATMVTEVTRQRGESAQGLIGLRQRRGAIAHYLEQSGQTPAARKALHF